MKLKNLLKLQFIYCLLGLLFNLISWIFIAYNYQALTSTIPVEGIAAMSIYGTFLLTGYFRKIGWYRFLMFISIIIFGYGGVVKHIFSLSQSPELYHSFSAGITGIMINIFGVVLNLIATLGLFKITTTEK
ncbi:MAG: hypothetical protein ACJAT4_000323 [Granulosicoccus sp.]|jgi:hypothetical protein